MEEHNPNSDKPKGYLMLHNIGKRNNLGTVIRSASAFNFEKVFLVSKEGTAILPEKQTAESTAIEGAATGEDTGIKKKRLIRQVIKQFHMFGDHGTKAQMEFDVFKNLKEAKAFFVANNITVCGVEITPESQSVVTHPFKGDTVFLLGNEGAGLIDAHKRICDHFVYIPQYTNKTASLNVSCAATLVFHHFAVWAGYQESKMYGEKFQDQSTATEQQQEDEQEKDDDNDGEDVKEENKKQIKNESEKQEEKKDADQVQNQDRKE